jgi:hypothetical protein
MEANQHISLTWKDTNNIRTLYADITQTGYEFILKEITAKSSKSLGRWALGISIVSFLATGYFSYQSNTTENRLSNLEQQISQLKQSKSDQDSKAKKVHNTTKHNP